LLQIRRKSAPFSFGVFRTNKHAGGGDKRVKKRERAGWEGACVQLAACVGEQRHRAPFGLDLTEDNIFSVGEGGCARMGMRVEGRGEKEGDHCQLSNLVRPRGCIVHPSKPPSAIQDHQPDLSNLPSCFPPVPSHPALRLQSTGHPTQIRLFRSRCRRYSQTNDRRDPRQIRTEPTSLTPNHTGSTYSHLASWTPVEPLATSCRTSRTQRPPSWTPRTRRPHHGCRVAGVFHPPNPRRSNPHPDKTKTIPPPYQR
jgi:hypothetical protein